MQTYAYLQITFFITEVSLLLFKRAKKSTVKTNRDNHSLLILWVTIGACISIGPVIGGYQIWAFHAAGIVINTGMAVCIIGFIIRWIAIIQLGKMFTVDVVIADKHLLKTTGLYKIVRHPSYLGLLLIIAGLALCTNSLLALIVVFVPCFLALNYRIFIEEKALLEEFGEQYIAYQSKVSKLIPGIY
jgi:protein-S-isoprenylcysteine O-methyltransferase Ste14